MTISLKCNTRVWPQREPRDHPGLGGPGGLACSTWLITQVRTGAVGSLASWEQGLTIIMSLGCLHDPLTASQVKLQEQQGVSRRAGATGVVGGQRSSSLPGRGLSSPCPHSPLQSQELRISSRALPWVGSSGQVPAHTLRDFRPGYQEVACSALHCPSGFLPTPELGRGCGNQEAYQGPPYFSTSLAPPGSPH